MSVVPHVRICAGGTRRRVSLPRRLVMRRGRSILSQRPVYVRSADRAENSRNTVMGNGSSRESVQERGGWAVESMDLIRYLRV